MAITRICAEAKRWVPAPAYPDFLLRSTRQDRVCGFLQGKPHAVRQRHQPLQEIRRTWDDNDWFAMVSPKGATTLTSAAQRTSADLVRISHNDSEQVRTGFLVKLRKVQQI
jgi:hypothetical protein